jgi:hypothetical protein
MTAHMFKKNSTNIPFGLGILSFVKACKTRNVVLSLIWVGLLYTSKTLNFFSLNIPK